MRLGARRAIQAGLLAVDAMLLTWSAAAALVLRYGIGGWPGGSDAGNVALASLLGGAALCLAALMITGMYELDELFSGHREYAGVVRSCTFTAFGLLLLAFLLDMNLSRGALVLFWGMSCVLVGSGRFVFRRLIFQLRRSGLLVRRALIAGTDEHAIVIAERLSAPGTGWQIVGFLDDYQPVGTEVAKGVRVVGDPGVAGAVAETLDASDIILVPHAVSWEAQRDLLEAAAACEIPAVRLAPGFYHLLAAGTRPFEANHVPLLSIERLRITGVDAALKTTLDYGIALLALPVLAMMAACLWLAARLSGGGAIVERGPAFGLRSRPFELLALAPPPDETPPGALGAWSWRLRRAAADGRVSKLANVLNVLTGRMSLVGPRALPASPVLLQRPWVPTLLLVRPGLTGPCHPNSARWSLEEQAIPDVAYVRDYSLWLDLRLLFRSFLRTVRRERALPASYQPAEGALAEPTGR